MNASGPGKPTTVTGATTRPPASAIGPVPGLRPTGLVTNSKIELAFDTVANAADYRLEYRPHDSDLAWQAATARNGRATLCRLSGNTTYDVRVAAAAPPLAGAEPVFGRWSTIQVATIGPRTPLWSDLVVAGYGANEIDVARVQMLFFTFVAAIFVLLRVWTSEVIPEIPDGFLLLMGVSNGVYLTAKFVPS